LAYAEDAGWDAEVDNGNVKDALRDVLEFAVVEGLGYAEVRHWYF